MKCAEVLDNPQIKEDPGVSDYNLHRFFLLNIVMPAAMEYVVEISGTPPVPTTSMRREHIEG